MTRRRRDNGLLLHWYTPQAELMMSQSQPSAGQAVVLTDNDLLAEVLIRLRTLADLGRACAVCASFRRVVTGAAFLRRVRALHPPTLLSLVPFSGGLYPAEPPLRPLRPLPARRRRWPDPVAPPRQTPAHATAGGG
uniref:F-box domain-containing protein n=1 Tax=Leersia perrieri TaxID=77586 RepID=A0A0D9XGD4_9ORYZ